MKYLDKKGMGLIEIMITMGIMSIVALGSTQLLYNSMMQVKTMEVKNSLSSLVGSLSQIALSQSSCTLAITVTPQQYNKTVRFDLPDGTIIANNIDVLNYPLTPVSFTHLNSTLVATGSDGTTVYFGTLALRASTKTHILGISSFSSRPIGLVYITVSPDGLMVGCGPNMPIVQTSPPPTSVVTPPSAPPLVNTLDIGKLCLNNGGNYDNGSCKYEHEKSCGD